MIDPSLVLSRYRYTGGLPTDERVLWRLARKLAREKYKAGVYPFGHPSRPAHTYVDMSWAVGRSLGGSVVLGEADKRSTPALHGLAGRWFDVLCPCGAIFQLPLVKVEFYKVPRQCRACGGKTLPHASY